MSGDWPKALRPASKRGWQVCEPRASSANGDMSGVSKSMKVFLMVTLTSEPGALRSEPVVPSAVESMVKAVPGDQFFASSGLATASGCSQLASGWMRRAGASSKCGSTSDKLAKLSQPKCESPSSNRALQLCEPRRASRYAAADMSGDSTSTKVFFTVNFNRSEFPVTQVLAPPTVPAKVDFVVGEKLCPCFASWSSSENTFGKFSSSVLARCRMG
eukprot:CAMPEP_0177569690 /NCGR_PEP_ID=MMETSP0369-20130122/76424_1 /TAXON_ID=447022 ORGANISM="Scrippsiella hangoei-like, Strain SHHI-4" /NCGR_SAMPLE_ID=MMETSP0369 /ASSEMBLY_ACC=CAM_ASM_000364 /LENGTH=215 /DNA_ID=CAMNT_0019057343 /DNA_START=135 /DNA_END=778 /DNA_ORIENTATION=+